MSKPDYSRIGLLARQIQDMWKPVGASLETATKCGLFGGGEYISMYDKEQADRVREINEQMKEKWAEMPITYIRYVRRHHDERIQS